MSKVLKRTLKIADKIISDDNDCFVIAEIGQNHQGDLEICKRLFEAAKFCGVDAVKLQKRQNRKIFTKKFFNSPYNSENAFSQTYGLHRQALEFNKKEYRALKSYAKKLGLILFATAWDFDSADFLNDLDTPAFKIASADITNIPLLTYIARLKKPMIISTGTATLDDVERAYQAVIKINKNIALLQCTSVYPTPASLINLKVIETYRKKFPQATIGLSSHFNGISVDPVAYTLGARIIEKHFTLDRSMKGTDHAFSLEPVGMKKLVRDLRRIRHAIGDGVKKIYPEEEHFKYKMGKKIVAARKLPSGHIIKRGDLTFKSPGDGIPPYRVDDFYGKALLYALSEDDALDYSHITTME